MGVGFLGFATALPEHVRDNAYWDGKLAPRTDAQRRDEVLAVERSARGAHEELAPPIREAIAAMAHDQVFRGARLRHVLAPDEQVSDLEARAVRGALAAAGVSPGAIDLVLVHSMLPDAVIPTNAPAIQAKCELVNAASWSLDVGCGSVQAQTVVASALIAAGSFARPLIVQSSCWTRFVDDADPQSVGFGDAASAAVMGELGEGYGILGHFSKTDGSFRDGIVFAPVKGGVPQRRYWEHEAAGALRMASFDVSLGKLAGQRATAFCQEACEGALARAGLQMRDVAHFFCNQSTGWFVDACRRSLGLSAEQAHESFADVANINECSLFHNMERARRAGKLRDGDILLFYSPAAGFTRSAMVYRHREGPP